MNNNTNNMNNNSNGNNRNYNNNRNNNGGGNNRRNSKTVMFETSGPTGRMKGTAKQICDKYNSLGRDAYSNGDTVLMENMYQHAEHYFRVNNYLQSQYEKRKPTSKKDGSDDAVEEIKAAEALAVSEDTEDTEVKEITEE
jgi:hypothetical protein